MPDRATTTGQGRSTGQAELAPLDRRSAIPLWVQLLEQLRGRLAHGEFESRFPTEEELTRDYQVSRYTVREAVRRLQADGLLVRERGRGTAVVHPELEQPLHTLYSLSRSVRAQGLTEHSKVLSRRITTGKAAAAALQLPPSSPLLFVERLRFAGDSPLSLERSWLPGNLASSLETANLDSGSLYDALMEHCELHVTGGWERIRPVNPKSKERHLLDLPASEVALLVERLAVAGEVPVEWRHSIIRGDRFWFRAEWPGPLRATIAL